MGDLTPFQNQVLDMAAKVEQEEQERKQEEARSQGNTPNRNARSKPTGSPKNSGMGQEETVRYVNKDLNPDHEVHESN